MPEPLPPRTVSARFSGIAIEGIVAALPERSEGEAELAAFLGAEAARKIAAATGIVTRHLAPETLLASDLGETACKEVLSGVGWNADSIDLLIVVTQTPDRPLPGNAPLLQHRLGIGSHCATLDINSGCSGFIDGLWTAASLLQASSARRVLLVVGDTTSLFVPSDDRATRPLFGDAVAAITLEKTDQPSTFIGLVPGSDGSGAPYLTVAEGGARSLSARQALGEDHVKPGQLYMDGTQVFAFTLRRIPGNIAAALDMAGWLPEDVDHLVLHQANISMIRHLAQKAGFTEEQTVIALADYGNTSSASIPLAMATAMASPLTRSRNRLLLSGFGVGWRWGAAAIDSGPLRCCGTVTVDGENQVVARTIVKGGNIS